MQDPMTRLLSFKKGELDLALSIAAKDVAELEKGRFHSDSPQCRFRYAWGSP